MSVQCNNVGAMCITEDAVTVLIQHIHGFIEIISQISSKKHVFIISAYTSLSVE